MTSCIWRSLLSVILAALSWRLLKTFAKFTWQKMWAIEKITPHTYTRNDVMHLTQSLVSHLGGLVLKTFENVCQIHLTEDVSYWKDHTSKCLPADKVPQKRKNGISRGAESDLRLEKTWIIRTMSLEIKFIKYPEVLSARIWWRVFRICKKRKRHKIIDDKVKFNFKFSSLSHPQKKLWIKVVQLQQD